MYKIIADLHTHTIASTHAYSTVQEMVAAAKEKGLYAIGITDHGYTMPGGPGPWYFENLRQLPVMQNGVKTIFGMESNVLDFDGNIDYLPRDRLDFVIASIHDVPGMKLENPTEEKCTAIYLALAENPLVHAIGHSGSPRFRYDYERVIGQFKKNHKLVEINSHSFDVRPDSESNCREIALTCKKLGAEIIVSSDAHFYTDVGNHTKALELLAEIDFPEELILNASVDRLNAYLSTYTNMNVNRQTGW